MYMYILLPVGRVRVCRVDFAIRLAKSVLNLPNRQLKLVGEFKLQKNCEINSARQNFLGLGEMTFGLVYASLSLPKWQAVKMTFFALCFVYSGLS